MTSLDLRPYSAKTFDSAVETFRFLQKCWKFKANFNFQFNFIEDFVH